MTFQKNVLTERQIGKQHITFTIDNSLNTRFFVTRQVSQLTSKTYVPFFIVCRDLVNPTEVQFYASP